MIRALPEWMHTRLAGQALWQWTALVLTLIATCALMLIDGLTGRWSKGRRGATYYFAVVLPVFAVMIPQAATNLCRIRCTSPDASSMRSTSRSIWFRWRPSS